jgi:hypothetical protein
MRKMLPVLMCVVLIAGLSGVAFADLSSTASTRVAVNVVSTVGVIVVAPAIPNYQIAPGSADPSIDVTFNIHSNSEMLQFVAGATNLYKGDVLTSAYFLTPVTAGVRFVCANANAINGANPLQPYIAPTTVGTNSWPGVQTGAIVFDSGDRGTFSQLCTLTFKWTSNDQELPVGQYSGFVKLVTTVWPII